MLAAFGCCAILLNKEWPEYEITFGRMLQLNLVA
jgi:hypothetical protein